MGGREYTCSHLCCGILEKPFPGQACRPGRGSHCAAPSVWGILLRSLWSSQHLEREDPFKQASWVASRPTSCICAKKGFSGSETCLSVVNISFSSTSPMGVQDSEAGGKRCTSKWSLSSNLYGSLRRALFGSSDRKSYLFSYADVFCSPNTSHSNRTK